MAARLRMSRITRVDLVDKGASFDPITGEGAHVLIHKRAPDPIAKKIVRRGEQWCVTDETGEKTLGCHDTEAAAQAQLDAVEANKERAAEKRVPWWTRAAGLLAALGIRKQDDGDVLPITFEEAFLARTLNTMTIGLGEAFGALYESIEGALRSPDVVDKAGAVKGCVDAFAATVQSRVQAWLDGPAADASTGEVEPLPADAVEEEPVVAAKIGRKIAGERLSRMKAAHKALGLVIREAEGGTSVSDTKKALDLSTLAEPVRKAIDAHITALTAEKDAAVAKCVALEKAAPVDPWAGVSADVRKHIEGQDAEIRKLRDQQSQATYVTKAAAFRYLPMKPDDDWRVLKAVDESLPEDIATRVRELLAAGEAAGQSAALFKAAGSDAGAGPGGDANAKIEAAALDMVAKTGRKGVSKAEAVDEFLRTPEGRKLYQDYLTQNPKQAGR